MQKAATRNVRSCGRTRPMLGGSEPLAINLKPGGGDVHCLGIPSVMSTLVVERSSAYTAQIRDVHSPVPQTTDAEIGRVGFDRCS